MSGSPIREALLTRGLPPDCDHGGAFRRDLAISAGALPGWFGREIAPELMLRARIGNAGAELALGLAHAPDAPAIRSRIGAGTVELWRPDRTLGAWLEMPAGQSADWLRDRAGGPLSLQLRGAVQPVALAGGALLGAGPFGPGAGLVANAAGLARAACMGWFFWPGGASGTVAEAGDAAGAVWRLTIDGEGAHLAARAPRRSVHQRPPVAVTPGSWNFYAVTRAGGTIELRLNGDLVAAFAAPSMPDGESPQAWLVLGNTAAGDQPWPGILAAIRAVSDELDGSQLAAIAASERWVFAPGARVGLGGDSGEVFAIALESRRQRLAAWTAAGLTRLFGFVRSDFLRMAE